MASVPHIYLSSQIWTPKNSITRLNLHAVFKVQDVIQNIDEEWDAVVWERNVGQKLHCISFSPDDGSVTCGAADAHIYSWDARSGATRGSMLAAHTERVSCLAHASKGGLLVSGSWDKAVRVWDTDTNEMRCEATLPKDVNAVALSPNGAVIAAGSDFAVRILDADTCVFVSCQGREGESTALLMLCLMLCFVVQYCSMTLLWRWSIFICINGRMCLCLENTPACMSNITQSSKNIIFLHYRRHKPYK